MADPEELLVEEEEARAERAREFRANLNKTGNRSRKRYSVATPYLQQGFQQGQSAEDNAFTTSTSANSFAIFSTAKVPSVQDISLDKFGTNLIYRDIDELQSLSKVKNFCLRLFPQPLKKALLPPVTWPQWQKFIFVHIPILHWLWTYRPKQLIGDTIAGITIGVTHVPQGIGFALLAALPPVFGLYSSLVPVVLYSFLGSSRHISVGTFPVVALMTGNAISRITHDLAICTNSSSTATMNMSMDGGDMVDSCGYSECVQLQINIAVTLSLLVGILMIIMSLLKMGFITLFLSDALVSGYTAAAAFTIFITQIKFLFGFNGAEAAVQSGFFTTIRRIIRFAELIFTGRFNWAAVITSIVCVAILLVVDYINGVLRRKVKKVPIHIPAQLIVVVLITLISYLAQLNERFGLPVISDLGGIPPRECFVITHPDFSLTDELITDAIIIAIISFVINISQAKLLAKKNSYSVHPDQEFFAYGVMNFGGSFFGSFPTAGALSRTVLQDATGGHTQLVGFISSAIVFIVIEFLGFLFGPLPNAALAAIVVVALKGLYFQVRDIYKYFKLSKSDMLVWLTVFFSTLIIGLDVGLGIGVIFSILVVVYHTVLPFSPEIGEARAWYYPPGDMEEFDEAELRVFRVPNVYIFQFNSPLYYANVSVFRSKLHIDTEVNPEEVGPKNEEGCIQRGCTKIFPCCDVGKKKQSTKELLEEAGESPYADFDAVSVDSIFGEDKTLYHTIIIDCAPIAFTDSMGVAMIEQVVREYDSIGIQVLLAAPTAPLCHALTRHRFFERYSSERLFPTVATAVAYAKDGHRVPQLEQPEKPDISLASNIERQLLYTARPTLLETKPIELRHRSKTRGMTLSQKNKESETTL